MCHQKLTEYLITKLKLLAPGLQFSNKLPFHSKKHVEVKNTREITIQEKNKQDIFSSILGKLWAVLILYHAFALWLHSS